MKDLDLAIEMSGKEVKTYKKYYKKFVRINSTLKSIDKKNNKIRKDKEDVIVSEYLYAFLNRAEFDRQVRFSSWGSSQELLSWNNLCDFQIPLPTFKEQCDIAEIFKSYTQRKKINEQLKEQIREMCPILIKGSLEEGKKIENFGGAEWQN